MKNHNGTSMMFLKYKKNTEKHNSLYNIISLCQKVLNAFVRTNKDSASHSFTSGDVIY